MSDFEILSTKHAEKLPCWDQLNELRERFQEEVLRGLEKDRILLQQDKMASIGQLAAGVAHEINNPMGFIMSNLGSLSEYAEALTQYIQVLEVMLDRFCPDEQKDHAAALRTNLDIAFISGDIGSLIRESRDGADRVKQIVHDLKDFARIDENFIKETDLNQCIRSTINIVKNELKYVAQLNLQLGDVPPVFCNSQQINQVITNLLVNAAQSIKGKGIITVKTWHEQDQVFFSVSDTGSGIPPEIVKRIFEPFFTTKPVGMGTGLGLTITYDLIRKHHGEISVESEPGKGSSFTVRLPLRQPDEDHIQ
jgi:two-component system, NtrC family, sensor kinase